MNRRKRRLVNAAIVCFVLAWGILVVGAVFAAFAGNARSVSVSGR